VTAGDGRSRLQLRDRAPRLAGRTIAGRAAIMMTRLALVLAVAACSKKSARIGVAECDAYQERMTECAAKLGGAVGKQLETVRETMLKAWTAERNNPGLARACSDATGDMQKQLPQCAW
jgi:hypothetical protein